MSTISRRQFCGAASLALAGGAVQLRADARVAEARRVTEWAFESGTSYKDAFGEVTLDVVFTDSKGREQVVPAFWAGGQTWRVRYAAATPGTYQYRTVCSDTANAGLHGRSGQLEVTSYRGSNPLYLHGPLQASKNGRYFEHADGTPFFWLGDTWWMGLVERLRWPEDFQRLAADRVRKGFNVIQIVAGLYPDMPPDLDPRGANEAGFPWEKGYSRIHPAYFDMADLRIQYLTEQGLLPCIVGCWGYYLPVLGMEKMKRHWRYLVARWGAYPVAWCVAGEGSMPYYLTETREQDQKAQREGWTEMGRYVRSIDPYHHPITIHPSRSARETVTDPSVLDFDMLQTGHGDRRSIPGTIQQVRKAYATQPTMPVINAEVCYEGILGGSRQDIQRFMFWSCILNGTCGHTYGANGIWQVNTKEKPYGASPHGRNWGSVPWDEAAQYAGSRQLGLAAGLLRRYPWWRCEPHPEWVEPGDQPSWLQPGSGEENFERAYAAGIPGELRIIYMPHLWQPPKVVKLETDRSYQGFLFNPMNGERHDLGRIEPNASGEWQMGLAPAQHDWVVVLEKLG